MKQCKKLIKEVDLTKVDEKAFKRQAVGCIVLSKEGKIILQQRLENWRTFPGCLATFGGGIDPGETSHDALVRELKEELGANVELKDVINLGVITEAITNYTELIHVFFWHDKQRTITGCYECEAKYYENCEDAYKHSKIMDDVRWALIECQKRGLLE